MVGGRQGQEHRGGWAASSGKAGGLVLFLPRQKTTLYWICGSLHPAEKPIPGINLGTLTT